MSDYLDKPHRTLKQALDEYDTMTIKMAESSASVLYRQSPLEVNTNMISSVHQELASRVARSNRLRERYGHI